MSNRSVMSVLIMVFGLLIAFMPQTFLSVCTNTIETASGNHVPMKCFWTAQASLGLGLLLFAAGVLLYFCKTILARLGISLMVFLTTLLVAAVPLVLIGVCNGETMPCRIGTLPGLLVFSTLMALISLGNILYLYKQSHKLA